MPLFRLGIQPQLEMLSRGELHPLRSLSQRRTTAATRPSDRRVGRRPYPRVINHHQVSAASLLSSVASSSTSKWQALYHNCSHFAAIASTLSSHIPIHPRGLGAPVFGKLAQQPSDACIPKTLHRQQHRLERLLVGNQASHQGRDVQPPAPVHEVPDPDQSARRQLAARQPSLKTFEVVDLRRKFWSKKQAHAFLGR